MSGSQGSFAIKAGVQQAPRLLLSQWELWPLGTAAASQGSRNPARRR